MTIRDTDTICEMLGEIAEAVKGASEGDRKAARDAEWLWQSDWLRCGCGNPFRPASRNQAALDWNQQTIPRMAHAIAAEGAFHELPILADAVEDAGWTDPVLLNHLREPGPHFSGCWALDLILANDR